MAELKEDRPKNVVRVGTQRSKYLYVDLTKHLLHDGEKEVIVSALGQAISDAVAVVEMLKNQGMVTVTKILTTRANTADRIEITVVKTATFDATYKEQQAKREEQKAARDAKKEAPK